MKYRLIALVALVSLLALCSSAALAETKTYSYALKPQSDIKYFSYGHVASKADNEGAYYVTQTATYFGSRPIFYRAVYPDGTGLYEVSKAIKMTRNGSKSASYTISVWAGREFSLGAIVAADGTDDTTRHIIRGRWTP